MDESEILNQPWRSLKFIVLDLEGTGAQHKDLEGIVEIAAIEIAQQQITSNYFYRLINPQIKIPPIVSRIHGLKNSDLEGKPYIEDVKNDLLSFINNQILIGHNVIIDYRLLKLRLPNYSPKLLLDTKKISKHFWREMPKHGLDQLIERFDIANQLNDLPIQRGRHSAYYDAYATGLLFLKMISEKFSPNATLKDVHNICGINLEDTSSNQISMF